MSDKPRIGICANPATALERAASGADYVEIQTNDLMAMSDADFAAFKDSLRSAGVRVEASNCFAPWSTRFIGPEADPEGFARYARAATARLAELGAEIVVFGCGGSRRVPDGVSREEGLALVSEAVKAAADAALPGQTVVVEPLNSSECNILTSVGEAARFAAATGRANVKTMADLYHMDKDGEPKSWRTATSCDTSTWPPRRRAWALPPRTPDGSAPRSPRCARRTARPGYRSNATGPRTRPPK